MAKPRPVTLDRAVVVVKVRFPDNTIAVEFTPGPVYPVGPVGPVYPVYPVGPIGPV